jgi:hypothetical protein
VVLRQSQGPQGVYTEWNRCLKICIINNTTLTQDPGLGVYHFQTHVCANDGAECLLVCSNTLSRPDFSITPQRTNLFSYRCKISSLPIFLGGGAVCFEGQRLPLLVGPWMLVSTFSLNAMRIVLEITASLPQVSWPPLVAEELKPSATHIVIINSQKVLQAGLKPALQWMSGYSIIRNNNNIIDMRGVSWLGGGILALKTFVICKTEPPSCLCCGIDILWDVPFLQNGSDMWLRSSSSWYSASVLTVVRYTTSWVSYYMGSMILKSIFKTTASVVRLSELSVVKNAVMVRLLPQKQKESLTTQIIATSECECARAHTCATSVFIQVNCLKFYPAL